jgi:hypothetical protein
VPIVRGLIEANPEVPARLLIGDDGISANPKLGNLVKGWDAARHEWRIIADSNVLMPRDFVQRLLAAWRTDSGVVCSMPIGSRPAGIWAELECAFLNTLQARFQYVSEALGWGFAQGKAMLFRRDIVARAGGIRALAAGGCGDDQDDCNAGLRVHLVDNPFEQPSAGAARRGLGTAVTLGAVAPHQLRGCSCRNWWSGACFRHWRWPWRPMPTGSVSVSHGDVPDRFGVEIARRASPAGARRSFSCWRCRFATCCCRFCGLRPGSAMISSGAAT